MRTIDFTTAETALERAARFASARRAALTDTADTAVRRMARDIRKALPNSIRQTSDQCVEFIPTKTGGRYRVEEVAAGR